MSDKLKVLLGKYAEKHHGLVARCVAEGSDDAVIHDKIHSADMAEKDAELVAVKAANEVLKAEVETLKASQTEEVVLADKKPSEKVMKAAAGSDKGVTFKETGDKSETPKTLTAAMQAEVTNGSKLKGFALREFCTAKYPNIVRA